MYSCTECHYVADTLANLRRHQTDVHQRTHFRSSLGHTMSCAVNGLPQCTFCFKTFTTWRQFQNHLDRQCCQVRPCDTGLDLDALLREEEEQRILRMHQSLVANLLNKPYGEALLDIVRRRDWAALVDQRSACQDLANQCCVCDFSLHTATGTAQSYACASPQVDSTHFHQGLPVVQKLCKQLTMPVLQQEFQAGAFLSNSHTAGHAADTPAI